MSSSRKVRAWFLVVTVLGHMESWLAAGRLAAWDRACRAAVDQGGLQVFAIRGKDIRP